MDQSIWKKHITRVWGIHQIHLRVYQGKQFCSAICTLHALLYSTVEKFTQISLHISTSLPPGPENRLAEPCVTIPGGASHSVSAASPSSQPGQFRWLSSGPSYTFPPGSGLLGTLRSVEQGLGFIANTDRGQHTAWALPGLLHHNYVISVCLDMQLSRWHSASFPRLIAGASCSHMFHEWREFP